MAFKQARPAPRKPTLPPDSLAYALMHAAELVAAVLEGRNLTEAWEEALAANRQWSDATRGAVRDLAWGTLRDFGRGDAVLAKLLHKPLPVTIHALLLLALHRLEVRPEQAHTVVNEAVKAAEAMLAPLKGVVNGVLRNYLREAAAFDAEMAADSVARHRHPSWWIVRVRKTYPRSWEAVLDAGNQHPPMALRANRLKTTPETVCEELTGAGIAARLLENGAVLLDKPVGVAQLPGFAEGRVSVQDAGAQWAAPRLELAAGQRVLDACAAPGGKSAHILESAPVELTALEVDPARSRRIVENLGRLGLSADVRCADCRDVEKWWDGRPFDRILADVPCSASGVARRHPDIKWLRRPEDIARFAAQQAEILDALWPTLAPGGRLLYVTCSIFHDENGAQIESFCRRHADARRVPIDGQSDGQLLPDAEHDGFYYALLEKHA